MKLTDLFRTDRAVSPVIGVILMVAITVLLAALIGTFVLGLGDEIDDAPQAGIDWTFADDTQVELVHDGGDQLDANTLSVRVGSAVPYDGGSAQGDWASGANTDVSGWGASITAGDGITLDDGSGTDHSGEEVRLVWASSSGGDTATIARATWSQ